MNNNMQTVRLARRAYHVLLKVDFDGIAETIRTFGYESKAPRGTAFFAASGCSIEVVETLLESIRVWLYEGVRDGANVVKKKGVEILEPLEVATIITFVRKLEGEVARYHQKEDSNDR